MTGHRRALDGQPGDRRACLLHELVNEARLPDSGLPFDGEDNSRTCHDLAPGRPEDLELGLTADEGEDTIDVWSWRRRRCAHREDFNFGSYSLELRVSEALHDPPLAEQSFGLAADDDGPRLRDPLDPRRDVGGVPEHGRVSTAL